MGVLLSVYIVTFIRRFSPNAYLWFICNHCSNYPLSHLNSSGDRNVTKSGYLNLETGKSPMASAELLRSFTISEELEREATSQE